MPTSDDAKIMLSALEEVHSSLRMEQDAKHSQNEHRLDSIDDRLAKLTDAFPGGDTLGHKAFHEGLIQAAEAKAKFYIDLKTRLAEKGIWAVVGTVATALYFYWQAKFKG